jgi:outer membrane protein
MFLKGGAVNKSSVVLIVSGLALLPVMVFGQLKIGYIDSNRILREFEDVRDAQAQLDKETRRLQVEYNAYIERLDSLRREFERQRLLMSNEKIREKEREIQSLEQTTLEFQQVKFGPEGEIYQYQAELMGPVLNKVDIAVKKIGAERSYDYIVDAAGGALVYALPAHDLTEDVITELRRSAANK